MVNMGQKEEKVWQYIGWGIVLALMAISLSLFIVEQISL